MNHKVAEPFTRLRGHGIRIRHLRPGAPPGSLETAQAQELSAAPEAHGSLMRYAREGEIQEQSTIAIADCQAPAPDAPEVSWIHLQGMPSAAQLDTLGRNFNLHALALEDVFNRETAPKVEPYEAQQFVVVDYVHRDAGGGLCVDQVSFFLGRNYLISIHEGPDDIFEPVRQRVRSMGRIRAHGADYLLYALLDLIVDSGFLLLDELGERIEALEDEVLDNPSRESRNRIHYVKRELVLMRRAWWPQREVLARLMRDDEQFFSDNTRLYMRDCYDHCVIVIDFVETYREMASSLLDTYISSLNQRMNDIMKTLTIIATIFLPLMFITGLYGMNFDTQSGWNMPELHWRFGYFYALGVMVTIGASMLLYFRRKRWF